MANSKVYLPSQNWEPTEFATILAIGDSWFWYPRNNVLQALVEHPRLKDPYRYIQLLGYNGARLEQVLFGRYARNLEKHLSPGFRTAYSAIMISGAGNDAVNYNLALVNNCSAIDDPAACLDEARVQTFIGKLMAAMAALLQRVTLAYGGERKRPDIFIHCYDYPTPDGRGFKLVDLKITGPWLMPAMVSRKVSEAIAFRTGVCHALIDHIAKAYLEFATQHSRVYCIDSRGCLRNSSYKKDWDNELHPTKAGFEQIVDKCWIPVLAERGFAN